MKVRAISRIQLVCADLPTTARFYETAFGFERIGEREIDSGRILTLRLGDQAIDLARFQRHGRPYPAGVSGANLLFQHLAIVVTDMTSAYGQLLAHSGWTAISSDGPQQLPPASGGVTAFKFRDPEGHPLELLAFRAGSAPAQWRGVSARSFLGIDHSALSVADSARSAAFYKRLGFTIGHHSHNVGAEQERLDGMGMADVDVTALASAVSSKPHIELLCYRGRHPLSSPPAPNDIAATRLVLSLDVLQERSLLRDPDGHLLLLEPS